MGQSLYRKQILFLPALLLALSFFAAGASATTYTPVAPSTAYVGIPFQVNVTTDANPCSDLLNSSSNPGVYHLNGTAANPLPTAFGHGPSPWVLTINVTQAKMVQFTIIGNGCGNIGSGTSNPVDVQPFGGPGNPDMPQSEATITGNITFFHNNTPAGGVNVTAYSAPMGPSSSQRLLASNITNANGTYSLWVNASDPIMFITPITLVAKLRAPDGNVTFTTPTLPPIPPANKSVNLYLSPVVTLRLSPRFNGQPIGLPGPYANCSFSGMVMDQQVTIPLEFFQNKTGSYDIIMPQDRNYSILLMTDPPGPSCNMGSPPKQVNNTGGTNGFFTNTSAANPSNFGVPTFRQLSPEMNFTPFTITGTFLISGIPNPSSASITFQNPLTYIQVTENSNGYKFVPPDATFPFKALNTSDFINNATGQFRITVASGTNYIFGGFANNDSNLSWGGYQNLTNIAGNLDINVTLYPLIGKRYSGAAITNLADQNSGDITTSKISFNVTTEVRNSSGGSARQSVMGAPLNLYLTYQNGLKVNWLLNGGQQNGERTATIPQGSNVTLEAFNMRFAPIKMVFTSSDIQNYATYNGSVVPVQMKMFDIRRPRRMPGNASENMSFSAPVQMQFLRSNATCSVPNAPPACNIKQVNDAREFDPTSSMMMGKVDLLMNQSTPNGNILVKYVGASLMSTGPPDAQYMDQPIEQSGGRQTWRFGSSAPKVYDYALVAMPYNSSAINENSQMVARIPLLYDQSGNVAYNRSDVNKTTVPQEYSDYNQSWFSDGGVTCSPTDQSSLCYQDKSADLIWMKILHFSEVGPQSEVTNAIASCQDLSIANTIYNLTQSVNSSGSCFKVLANNVTLRGNGYTVNYSQAVDGYAVNNTGYSYLTVRDLNIVQGNASISPTSIFATSMENSTIANNTIIPSGGGLGIYFETLSRGNTISGNRIRTTAMNGYGIYLDLYSTANTVANNNVNTTGDYAAGIFAGGASGLNTFINNTAVTYGNGSMGLYASISNGNTYTNNTVTTFGPNSSAIYLYGSSTTTVTGGTLISLQGSDYSLENADASNNFTNTDFNFPRKINLTAASYFRYRDNPAGNLWLTTNFSADGEISRIIYAWNTSLVKWNDTNTTTLTATYALTGLTPNTAYNVFNTSFGSQTRAYQLTSDTSGNLPSFAIKLRGSTQIRVQQPIPPTIAILLPVNATSYANTSIRLNYTVSDDAAISQCKYELDGGANVSLPSCSNATLTSLSQGGHAIKVWANDTDDNWNASPTVYFTVDSLPPGLTISQPQAGFTNSAILNFTVNDASATASCNYTSNGASYFIGPTVPTGTPNITAISGITEGINYINVTCTDTAGNSNTSATTSFTRDTTSPSVAINYPPAGFNTSNTSLIANYTAVDALAPSMTCRTYLDGALNYTDPSVQNNTPATYALTGLSESNHTLNVTCTDLLGNNGSYQKAFTVDLTNPGVTISAPINGSIYTSVPLNFTATDNRGGSLYCNKTINGVEYTLGTVQNGTTNTTSPSWAEGTNTISVTCWDNAGNSNTTPSRTFTYDSRAPSLSLLAPAGGLKTNASSVSMTFNAVDAVSANLTCSIYADGAAIWSGSWPNSTNKTKAHTYTDGIHYGNVTCTDAAGNSNTTSTINFTVDLNPPQVVRMYSYPARPYNNTNLTIYANLTDSATSIISAALNITKQSGYSYTVPLALSGGLWANATLADELGAYSAVLTATDEVGWQSNYTYLFHAAANKTLTYNITNSSGGASASVSVSIIAPENNGTINSSSSNNATLSVAEGNVTIRITDSGTNVTIDLPVFLNDTISFAPVLQQENHSAIAAPPTANTPLLAQTITPNVTISSSATLRFNYSSRGIPASEAYRLRVYKCTAYNSTNGYCPYWTELSESIDNATETVTATVDSFSTFMLSNKTSVCGNLVTESGEGCDAGPSGSASCTSSCTVITQAAASGGGSSPSTSSAPVAKTAPKESKTIAAINPGVPVTINISKEELSVSRITIDSLTKALGVLVSVEKLDAKPSFIPAAPAGTVYRYLNLSSSMQSASLNRVTVRFRVETSWIKENNYSTSSVYLNRYSQGWSKLPTSFIGTSGKYSEFEAISPGFSAFAITGEAYVPPPAPETPAPQTQPEKPIPVEPTPTAFTPVSTLVTQGDIDAASSRLDAVVPKTNDARDLIEQARLKIAEAQSAFNSKEQAKARRLLDDANALTEQAAGVKSVSVSKGKSGISTILLIIVALLVGAYAYQTRPQPKEMVNDRRKLGEERATLQQMKKNAEKEYLTRKIDQATYKQMLADYESRIIEVNTRLEKLDKGTK